MITSCVAYRLYLSGLLESDCEVWHAWSLIRPVPHCFTAITDNVFILMMHSLQHGIEPIYSFITFWKLVTSHVFALLFLLHLLAGKSWDYVKTTGIQHYR